MNIYIYKICKYIYTPINICNIWTFVIYIYITQTYMYISSGTFIHAHIRTKHLLCSKRGLGTPAPWGARRRRGARGRPRGQGGHGLGEEGGGLLIAVTNNIIQNTKKKHKWKKHHKTRVCPVMHHAFSFAYQTLKWTRGRQAHVGSIVSSKTKLNTKFEKTCVYIYIYTYVYVYIYLFIATTTPNANTDLSKYVISYAGITIRNIPYSIRCLTYKIIYIVAYIYIYKVAYV